MVKLSDLYSFATNEFARDATLAYILEWSQPGYSETHPRLHQLGTTMLYALLDRVLIICAIGEYRLHER